MDLDGKGAGSPEGLVSLILRAVGNLPVPTPIEDLCRRLDIQDIAALETDGFEGALITDTTRSTGIILVNQNRSRQRQRFTIAHELGHFLIPTHVPNKEGRFLCSSKDLARLDAQENDRRARMEVEANRFAALILMPPPALREHLRRLRGCDLQHILQLARTFDVSREAMARSYATYHSDPVAVMVTHQGVVRRVYRDRVRFPFLAIRPGQPVPSRSVFHRGRHDLGVASEHTECEPELWIENPRRARVIGLTEQFCPRQDGYGLLLVRAEVADEDEDTEDRELSESWRPRFRK